MSYLPPPFPKRPLPSGMYARPKQGGLVFFISTVCWRCTIISFLIRNDIDENGNLWYIYDERGDDFLICAHIRKTADGGAERQSVEAHCRGTADIAAACLPETLRGVGAIALGYAAGPAPEAAPRKENYIVHV